LYFTGVLLISVTVEFASGLGVGLVWVLKNFFSVKVWLFCLRQGRCSWFCMVFRALLTGDLLALSTWFSVTFNVG